MSKLLFFGCSYTKYYWPTWADILAKELEGRYSCVNNFGNPGLSNFHIFTTLIESNLDQQITKNDTVFICWSRTTRINYYRERTWFTPNFKTEIVDQYHTKNDLLGLLLNDFAVIEATKTILDSIGCEYHFGSIFNFEYDLNLLKHKDKLEFKKKYNHILRLITTSVEDALSNCPYTRAREHLDNIEDYHPSIAQYLHYLNRVYPQFEISESTKDWIDEWEEKLSTIKPVRNKSIRIKDRL